MYSSFPRRTTGIAFKSWTSYIRNRGTVEWPQKLLPMNMKIDCQRSKKQKKQTRFHNKHENCKEEKSMPRKTKISEANLRKNFRELLGGGGISIAAFVKTLKMKTDMDKQEKSSKRSLNSEGSSNLKLYAEGCQWQITTGPKKIKETLKKKYTEILYSRDTNIQNKLEIILYLEESLVLENDLDQHSNHYQIGRLLELIEYLQKYSKQQKNNL